MKDETKDTETKEDLKETLNDYFNLDDLGIELDET